MSIEFIKSTLKLQLESFYSELLNHFPELSSKISIFIQSPILLELIYESNEIKENNTSISLDVCHARIMRNGEELQCSKSQVSGNLCKRHSNKLLYGLITENIPSNIQNKFTKLMDKRLTRIDNSIESKKDTIYLNFNKIITNRNSNKFKKVIYQCEPYYYDPIFHTLYTYSDRPCYIGIFNNDEIVI